MVKHLMFAIGGASLGLLLVLRLADGTAGFLVQSWYRPVLFVSALALVALAGVTVLLAWRSGERFSRPTGAGALTTLLVAIPVVLGFAFKPEPLAGNSLDSGDSSPQFNASAGSSDPALRNVYQWAYEFETAQPADIVGDPVEVVGFVYHKKDDPAGQFQVARFVVACCVADAQGFSLPVLWKDAAALPADRWVRVKGRVATASDGSALIQATEIEPIEAPSNPYIYP
jgi:putative membrane protein